MKLEQSDQGWIVRVPDSVVAALDLCDGSRVTLRPARKAESEIAYAVAELRGRLPGYPFDRANWDGVDATPID